jgi:hypothetical protein
MLSQNFTITSTKKLKRKKVWVDLGGWVVGWVAGCLFYVLRTSVIKDERMKCDNIH